MRKIFLLVLLALVITVESKGQEGIYYFGANSKPVTQLADALFYQEVVKKSDRKFVIESHQIIEDNWKKVGKEKIKIGLDGNQTIHYNDNTLFSKKFYRSMEKVGPSEYLFKESTLNGEIRNGTSTAYLPLHLEGNVVEYHPNREVKSRSIYRDNQLVSNENWLSSGSRYIDSLFYSVDTEPEYQMGDGFFKNYLIRSLEKSGIDMSEIEDLVVLGWVVMENGELRGSIALTGKSRQLNEFLVKTIAELPGYWTPALLDGVPVRYFMSIPLNFMHREVNFQELELSPGGVMHYNKY
jgi:antitoxin component YwqK of YwqJK toxin-antitoxin module